MSLAIQGLWCFHLNVSNFLVLVLQEKLLKFLIGISENSNSFGDNMGILTELGLLIHGHGLPIHYVCLQFLSTVFYSTWYTELSLSWLNLSFHHFSV